MNTEHTGNPSGQAQIRQLIADWTDALCAKDLDRLMSH